MEKKVVQGSISRWRTSPSTNAKNATEALTTKIAVGMSKAKFILPAASSIFAKLCRIRMLVIMYAIPLYRMTPTRTATLMASPNRTIAVLAPALFKAPVMKMISMTLNSVITERHPTNAQFSKRHFLRLARVT